MLPVGAGKLEGEVHLEVLLKQSPASITANNRDQAAVQAAPAVAKGVSSSSTSAAGQAASSAQQGAGASVETKMEVVVVVGGGLVVVAAPKASYRCCGKLWPTKPCLPASLV